MKLLFKVHRFPDFFALLNRVKQYLDIFLNFLKLPLLLIQMIVFFDIKPCILRHSTDRHLIFDLMGFLDIFYLVTGHLVDHVVNNLELIWFLLKNANFLAPLFQFLFLNQQSQNLRLEVCQRTFENG